jgi:SNF2 family DNA or RNA helicase
VLAPGNLVRWRGGQLGQDLGVVVESWMEGRRAKVLLDIGDELSFALPTDVLSRVVFSEGATVLVKNDGSHGVVTHQMSLPNGVAVYRIALPDGSEKTVPEDSLRPAQITNPATLLRRGEYGETFRHNLRVAATRLAFAHQYDELSSLSNSRVEIKPHQVGVLSRVAATYPHRFLLADEVGLGKTIEAGLIIKELKARGVANRVLVLAPSGIVSQWQFELKTKFNEVFAHYNRATIDYLSANHPGENVWTLHDNVIASTSFAAHDEDRQREIALAGWDLVVIDEAHHARRTWQGQSRYSETLLYQLAAALADPERSASSGYLLLTATPMQLHRFELYSLVELLDPALFPTFEDFDDHADSLAGLNVTVNDLSRWPSLDDETQERAVGEIVDWLGTDLDTKTLDDPEIRAQVEEELASKHRLSEVLIRNRKSVVGGFMPRQAKVWNVDPTEEERAAYDAVIAYVRTGYAKSQETRNNALGFLMATFQKMNSSSSHTLARSLTRRIARLEGGLTLRAVDEPEDEDLEEQTSEEGLKDLEGIESRLNTLEEIAQLRELVGLLDAIEIDSKANVLREGLNDLRGSDPKIKVLIFTQFRDTQSYLEGILRSSWTVRVFNGQLSPAEKDDAVAKFRDEPGPQVLISTEAGGEGRNLQFVHTLVNYDLPWNPMRIEQRIGRLDRIGQKHVVTIINLAVAGTIEERVLEVLNERIKVFEDTIGGLDPILGTVETDLKRLFLLDPDGVGLAVYEADLEQRVFDARRAEERMADFIMDTKSFRQDEVRRVLEQKGPIDSAALERFMLKALRQLGVRNEPDPEVDGVFTLRLAGQFLQEFPEFAREGVVRRVTFDPAVALDYETIEFLAFGHELVEAVADRVRSRAFGGTTTHRAVRAPGQGAVDGWFFTFMLEFEGVTRTKELYPVFLTKDGSSDPLTATWLLDQSSLLDREDRAADLTRPTSASDEVLQDAEQVALARLMERRAELNAANKARLEQERSKLERYFDYRQRAAAEKLDSVQRTFDNISLSSDPGVQRIIPVWAKNLENARRVVETLASERVRRIGELAGRDQVSAQHEMLTGAFVTFLPADAQVSSAS